MAKPISVLVLGGGVGGLSAAHELAERGYRVTVLEASAGPGGKARTIFVPGTGSGGRRDLPGEHGFRFFPSFYRHLPDTMARIPFGKNQSGVAGNLVGTSRTRLARLSAPEVDVITRFPVNLRDVQQLVRAVALEDLGLPWTEVAFVAGLFLTLLTTCHERRMAEHEHATWWEFIGADRRSGEFQRYFADIAVRSLVAMCPKRANTRTIGRVGMQLWVDHARPGTHVDRVLDGPTQEAWIDPWVSHLRRLGVELRFGARVVELLCKSGRICGVKLLGEQQPLRADHYVAALPVERFRPLLTDSILEAEPGLANLDLLSTEWMTGLQFFLRERMPVVHGHLVLVDSPWAITAISQAQFWRRTKLSEFGDGRVRDVLSAIISNWQVPGAHVKKPAMECSHGEIRDEVWWQLRTHLRRARHPVTLDESDLVDWYLADSIEFRDGKPHNREPLFINTVGSWRYRPDAITAIENLFLASDYVRTSTDIATMESANEAARRATNGILAACGSTITPCDLWPFHEPPIFRHLQRLDELSFRVGAPHPLAGLLGLGTSPRRACDQLSTPRVDKLTA